MLVDLTVFKASSSKAKPISNTSGNEIRTRPSRSINWLKTSPSGFKSGFKGNCSRFQNVSRPRPHGSLNETRISPGMPVHEARANTSRLRSSSNEL